MKRGSWGTIPSIELTVCLITIVGCLAAHAEAPASATAAFGAYVKNVEAQLAEQHTAADRYLANEDWSRTRQGELLIEEITPTGGKEVPGGLLHHWRGSAFIAGAKAADFEHVLKDFAAYPQRFAPQILRMQVNAEDGDRATVTMRAEQKHVLTVVMDQTYEIQFGRLDAAHGYSLNRSTRIAEIAQPGTAQEHALGPGEDHGFLWRQNSYWSYAEGDGGLYVQIESVSLSRTIPAGLSWIVRPFVEGIPRDTLEFTLRGACQSLRR